MAKSKGMAKESARGYSEGNFGHGGHHRKDFHPAPMKQDDHMRAPTMPMENKSTAGMM